LFASGTINATAHGREHGLDGWFWASVALAAVALLLIAAAAGSIRQHRFDERQPKDRDRGPAT
jgi:anti-sigma-K factor RskA